MFLLDGRMVAEWERIWKEAVVTYLRYYPELSWRD
jgi:hypothetical protein